MRGPVRVALAAAAVLLAGATVALVLFEWKAAGDRWSVSETEARLAGALPPGSSSDVIKAYLRKEDLFYDEFVVSENYSFDTYLSLSGIGVGTRVIWAQRRQEDSLIGLGPRMIEIIFVLSEEDTLERFFVYGHDPI